MRIAIDIRRIGEFGVGTYTRNAIRTLARLDRENRSYFLIGIPGKVAGTEGLPANFKMLPAQPTDSPSENYFELHQLLKRFRCDLSSMCPIVLEAAGHPVLYVVTVHDLLDQHVPRQQPSPM